MSELLERARPLAGLCQAAARASTSRPRVVVVRGPVGSGRSALLDEAGDVLAPSWDVRSMAPPSVAAGPARDGGRSVAVLLDDADARPDAVLDQLADQLDAGALALAVLAVRSGSDADGGPLGRVVRRPGTHEISLCALTPPAVRTMVAATLGTDDPELASEIHRRSGGLPALVVALLQEPDDPLPVTVFRLVRRALATLSPAQRELVELLAVTPAPIPLDVLEAGIARAEAVGVRDAGLAVLTGEGLAVHPPVVADVLLAELPLARRLAHQRRLARCSPEDAPPLTPRERSLLSLLTEGCTNRQMAERLHLSEKTVRNQLSTLFPKLGVERRSQAAVLAVQLGIHPPAS